MISDGLRHMYTPQDADEETRLKLDKRDDEQIIHCGEEEG
jgi:hypothetical protein